MTRVTILPPHPDAGRTGALLRRTLWCAWIRLFPTTDDLEPRIAFPASGAWRVEGEPTR